VTTGRREIVGRSWASRRDDRDVAQVEDSRAGGDDLMASKTVPRIPHSDYRVLATAAAVQHARLRGSSTVETRDHAAGKDLVDKLLVERGLGVRIPHARPGRVTR
jgi:hypothetical protein